MILLRLCRARAAVAICFASPDLLPGQLPTALAYNIPARRVAYEDARLVSGLFAGTVLVCPLRNSVRCGSYPTRKCSFSHLTASGLFSCSINSHTCFVFLILHMALSIITQLHFLVILLFMYELYMNYTV